MKQKMIVLLILLITFTANLFSNIGQRFIITLPETHHYNDIKKFIQTIKPSGVMLTAAHLRNRIQAKKLISFLQTCAKQAKISPLFICVDWEGGIVSRPQEQGGFFSVPSPWSLARAGRSSCFLAGMLIGHQLADIGVNVNFAPSLDLFNQNNYILATRCFDENPEKVAECGYAFAQGLLSQGVLPVIKHFPGLGLGVHDTHLDATSIKVDKETFDYHKKPFEMALQKNMPMVMAGHAVYSQFGDQPATLNKNVVRYLKKINPETLLITDDFCMQGVREKRTLVDACKQSLDAGYHLIIFSPAHAPEFIKHHASQPQLEKILEELSVICSKKEVLKEIEQINKIKEHYLNNKKNITSIDEKELSTFLAKRCLQIDTGILSPADPVILISAKLTAIRTAEQWLLQNNQSYLCKQLQSYNIQVEEHIFDPTNKQSIEEIAELVAQLEKDSSKKILLQTMFYGGGSWNSIQKQWLEKLTPLQNQLTIISLGHPYEQMILPNAKIINIGSFQQPLLNTLVHRLCAPLFQTGADQLINNLEKFLLGKKFGILCHRCSVAQKNNISKFLPDILYEWAQQQKKQTKLAALFSPEHGLLGKQEAFAFIDSEQKSRWGCPVYSLHGEHKKPTPNMLKDLDLLIIDLQDIGTRCFTYLSSLKLALEAAAENNVSALVLDRPNPLAFWGAAGPELEPAHESFLGAIYAPFLHGSTIGQLAQSLNKKIGTDLNVIACKNISDDYFLSQTFIPPSPNIMSIGHAYAYPMTVFLEGTNYSEGRGTNYPFLQIGAPWINAQELASTLNQKKLVGVFFEPINFIPQSIRGVADNPKHQDTLCHGIFIHLFNHKKADPMIIAKTILGTLFALYPEKSKFIQYGKRYAIDSLIGTSSWREEIMKNVQQEQLIIS